MAILYLRKHIKRSLEPVIQRTFAEFPAVILSGPRAAGKTSLLKNLFGDMNYVSLGLPDVHAHAAGDPRGFLDRHSPPVIIDDLQYAPGLIPYLKERLEKEPEQSGQYLLSGSHALFLNDHLDDSLSRRMARFTLLPLSLREMSGLPDSPLPWETASPGPRKEHLPPTELWASFLKGCYPELVINPDLNPIEWHGAYLKDFLEREVRLVRQISDLVQFHTFLQTLAARSGQLLNLTEIARNLGVAVNTTRSWLAILEATGQVIVLKPFSAPVRKRLAKTPKVYFTDPGTLCYLSGLRDPGHAASGPLGSTILKTVVLTEILKTLVHRGEDPRISFWRTSAGNEVDILVPSGSKIIPVEVRLSATPTPAMASGISSLRKDIGDRVAPGYVVHPGDVRLRLTPEVAALPLGEL